MAFANQLPNLWGCTTLSCCSSQSCSTMAHSSLNVYLRYQKTQPTQNQNTAFPPRLAPFFYFLWMTKKITLCTQARNMVCKKNKSHHQNWVCFSKVPLPNGVFVFSETRACCQPPHSPVHFPKAKWKKLVLSFLRQTAIIQKSLDTQHCFFFYSSPTSGQMASTFVLCHLTNAC